MSTPSQPRRKPGAGGRTLAKQEPGPGTPSWALRARAAGGWEKSMRRAWIERGDDVAPRP
ncbi:hypothetical protein [Streptomyces lavendulae]|uniref:hypothetical protein n=1 Tax=Streptomyces lavendulae TaxID=1914 RepID=UPI0024A52222|nr:hypothetical protein [Streptomyces lavendulae]GLW04375.1 hypothetical protein Slala05_80050 [Streptomyces lavendulae subsp. lavendulae]